MPEQGGTWSPCPCPLSIRSWEDQLPTGMKFGGHACRFQGLQVGRKSLHCLCKHAPGPIEGITCCPGSGLPRCPLVPPKHLSLCLRPSGSLGQGRRSGGEHRRPCSAILSAACLESSRLGKSPNCLHSSSMNAVILMLNSKGEPIYRTDNEVAGVPVTQRNLQQSLDEILIKWPDIEKYRVNHGLVINKY